MEAHNRGKSKHKHERDSKKNTRAKYHEVKPGIFYKDIILTNKEDKMIKIIESPVVVIVVAIVVVVVVISNWISREQAYTRMNLYITTAEQSRL